MPATLLGFVLLALLGLGLLLVALSVALLAAAFLLYAVAPAVGGAAAPAAATTVALAAAALLAVGLLLCLAGLFAFSFPNVSALLRLLRILLRVAARLAPTPQKLGEVLEGLADALAAVGGFLNGSVGPGLVFLSGKMETAGTPLPNIPTVSGHVMPLWTKRDAQGHVTQHGAMEYVPGAPDVFVLTDFNFDPNGDLLAGAKTLLNDRADEVEGAGNSAATVGAEMSGAAVALREVADIVAGASTP